MSGGFWLLLVALFVLGETTSATLTFTIQPADAVVVVGQSLMLNCQATESTGATILYNWKKDSQWLVSPTPSDSWRQLSNNSLYYASIRAGDVGEFKCGAAVSGGSSVNYSRVAKVEFAYLNAVFTSNPLNTTKRVGNAVTFTCMTGLSKPAASIYWEKDGVKLTGYVTASMQIAQGDAHWTTASLRVSNIQLSSAGFYRCVAVNPMLPNEPKKSIAGYLHVLPAIDKPHFQVRPSSRSIPEHQSGILQCLILGVPTPLITWTFNGQSLQNSADRYVLSNGSLYFKSANRSMTGDYACTGSNSVGSVSSSPVLLSVAYFDFVFFKQPSSQNVSEGTPLTLECDPPTSYPTAVTINWFKDYQPVQAGSGLTISSSGSLVFSAIKKADEGQYFCNGVNSVLQASRTSRIATVIVWVRPTFQVNPKNVTVIQSQALLLDCQTTGYPMPTVEWLKDNLPVYLSRVTIHPNNSLSIARSVFADRGMYSCVATNIAGSAVSVAMVTVYVPPTVSRRPVNATRIVGEPQAFTCLFQGFPAPAIQWFHNNGTSNLLIQASSDYVISGGTLTIRAVTKGHEGTYTCKGVNQAGMASASAYLYIKVPVSLDSGPVNITVNQSSTASFQCQASGDPKPTVTWYKGQVQLTHGGRIVIGADTLTILQAKTSDSGEYRCKVDNGLNATHFGSAHLIVQVAPTITSFQVPVFAQLSNQTTLVCAASGIPEPAITWYKDESDVTADGSRVIFSGGMLRIMGVKRSDGGTYRCQAANAAGAVAREGNLTIQVPPDPPRALSAIPLSSMSIRLSWQPGFDGHSSITGYKVERLIGSSFQVLAAGIVSTSYTVTNLRPFTRYTFRIRANNVIGVSSGTNVTNTTEEDAPSEPTNVIVTSLNSTSIKVTWSAPVLPNGKITWYEIAYRRIRGVTSTLRLPASSPTQLAAVIIGLLPYTEYAVSLRAATGKAVQMWGNLTSDVVTRTGNAAPSVAPSNVVVTALNSSTIQVSWQNIPPASANGIIRHYLVSYKATGPYHLSGVAIANTTGNSTLIGDLHSWTNYRVSVRAVTVSPGPASDWKVVRTRESTPSGPPLNVTMTALSAHSIMVTMVAPEPRLRNGNITGFKVYYNTANSADPGAYFVLTDGTEARLENLTTYTEYVARVAALTASGQGVLGEKVRARTGEGVPGTVNGVTVVESSHNHVILTWNAPRPVTGVIQHYLVTFNSSNNETNTVTTATTSVTLANLDPNTTYTIWVVAKTNAGYGPKGRALTAKTALPPVIIPSTSPPTEPTSSPPNVTKSPPVVGPGAPAKQLLSERDIIIVSSCLGAIVLCLLILALYFVIKRRRSTYREALSKARKRRQGAIDMDTLRGVSPDKRPVLDVQEETSIPDDSFDDGSEWESTITGMPSEPVSEPIAVVIPSISSTPVLQPVTLPEPRVTQSEPRVTRPEPRLMQPSPQNKSNQHAGGPIGSDRSPLTKLRNKKLSVDSTDGSLYDQPYSSVDELGAGFSSFTPPPPPDFRSEPGFMFSDPDSSPEGPQPGDRRSFTNKLYKAVRDDQEEKPAEFSDQGFSEPDVKSDTEPEMASPEPEELPPPIIPPDIEGFANEGYDEELDKYLGTIPDLSPKYRPDKGPQQRSKSNTPSTSPPKSPTSQPPSSKSTSPSASSPRNSTTGTPVTDIYAKVDMSKKKKKKKSTSSEPGHDAVVVYDERTNL